MTSTLEHSPILHDSVQPWDGTCTYTGPADDMTCPTEPGHHVVFITADGWRALRACHDHVLRAIEVAQQEAGGEWWAHRLHPDCYSEGTSYVVDSYCTPNPRTIEPDNGDN